jgi:hypothetical protein
MLIVCSGFLVEVHADETIRGESQVTVPWDEFKKLLHLDENEIVLPLETFQKLLAQTGIKTTPTHTVKEGNVVLTRAEFKKLVDQMKPPTGPDVQPPFDYLITKATYSGIMRENTTTFTGVFNVHVLKKDVYLKIPLLPQSIALEEVTVGDKQAQVVSENGYHNVVLSQSGEYVVVASFSLKSSLEKGPHRIDLTIQQTPITLLKLTLPLKNIDVEIPQAQQLLTDVKDDTSIVSAIIAPGRVISIRWRKKVTVAEKIPPKLYSETYHLISIEDDALKINSDINYTILHSEVDNVRLSISEGINVLNISGEGVGEWQEVLQEDQRLILIPFTYSKKGAVTVNVTAEKPLSDKGATNGFSGIRVLDTVRETGSIGIELNTSAEVIAAESEGLEKVAVEKLPRILYNKSVKPLILGFKYLKHPYSLVLDIHKHEKISVPVATINSASAVTLFTEDGKVVHRLVYQVRNSAKQFLEMQLPDKADVWSVFVANEPVESSINSQGKLLVPLIRSRSVNNRLDTFPVEIIYCLVEERFSPVGMQTSSLPAVDLLISQLIWSVYLPNDYAYIYFRSTLEKEEMIRGLNILSGPLRQYDELAMKEVSQFTDERSQEIKSDQLKKAYKGKDYMSSFRNLPLKEEQLSNQVHAEFEFGGRLEGLAQQGEAGIAVAKDKTGTGILPIQIEIPTGGQVYRFAKTIIKAEDPLTVSVIYTQHWLIALLKWLFFVFILWVIYLKRKAVKMLFQQSKDKLGSLANVLNQYDAPLKHRAQSKTTPFVLVGLLVVSLFISRLLALLVFFLLWISVIYQIFLYREKKAQTKPEKTEEHGQSNGSF